MQFRELHKFVLQATSDKSRGVTGGTHTDWASGAVRGFLNALHCEAFSLQTRTYCSTNCFPIRIPHAKVNSCSSRKNNDDSVAVMMGANRERMEKVPLPVVSKFRNLQCIKNMCLLQAGCTANRRSWTTEELFGQWLQRVDRKFERDCRRAFLYCYN